LAGVTTKKTTSAKKKRPSRRQRIQPIQSNVNIIQACLRDDLFGKWFKHDKYQWITWFTFLRTMFGLKLLDPQLDIYQKCTGRKKPTQRAVQEAYLICGRRSGKSRVLALMAVFLACFVDWRPCLAPGERGTIILVATDRKQARVMFRYIEAFLKQTDLLKDVIIRDTREMFELKKSINIEIHTASLRGVRGYTIVAALLDEIAFFRSEESTNPDTEILEALRPGTATVPGSMILCASSPYDRRGVLWEAYQEYYGKEDPDILVWKAPTWVMNPTVPDKFLKKQFRKDPVSADAEYGGNFRMDVSKLVSEEVILSAIEPGLYELPYIASHYYTGFVDVSGGSSDSYTLGIAHYDEVTRKVVLDLVREWMVPFSPMEVTRQAVSILKAYGISEVTGDRYGGEWPREQFEEGGINYNLSPKTKTELYQDLLPMLNSGTAQLVDMRTLKNQLKSLERRTQRGGREIIDHPPKAKDDVANAAAGAVVLCNAQGPADVF